MKKILPFLIAFLFFATPAFSTVLFYEDFEDALDFVNDWSQGTSHGSRELTTEQVRHGSKSYKVSVTSQGQEYRKEGMVPIKFEGSDWHFTIGNEYWLGFSLFLHSSYQTPSDNGGILHYQAHGDPDEPPTCDPQEPWRNPPFHIGTADGKWQTSSKWDSPQCSNPPNYTGTYWLTQDAFSTGQWVDFVVNVKWSYGASGFLKVWRDGTLKIDRTGGNCFNDNEGPYLWIGIYSYHIDNGQTITIYWDEFRIGDSTSSYAEVVPGMEIFNISPANNSTGVSITADLAWTNPTAATHIDLLFDKKSEHDPPTTVELNDQDVETWDCGTLDYSTEYAWRVDVNHAGGTETGTVYYFTTTSQANPPLPSVGMNYCPGGVGGNYSSNGVGVR